MRQVRLETPNGSTMASIPLPGDFDSFYVFAMHKSGSTLLNNMLMTILAQSGIPQMAISELAFAAGLPEDKILNPEEVIFEKGYCYRGYRSFPEYLYRFDLSAKKKILLIRDPRDMVVSFFFSCAQSHIVPEAGVIRDEVLAQRKQASETGIDEFCLANIVDFIDEFIGYEHLLNTDIRIYRYEDVIFNKVTWLQDMLSYLGIGAALDDIRRVAHENDVIPREERPDRHIRQVYPGNFRKHLKRETIEKLSAMLQPILQRYHYRMD
jgi:hypothetical protein